MIGNDYPAITSDSLGLFPIIASAGIALCCSSGLGCALFAAMVIAVRWLA